MTKLGNKGFTLIELITFIIVGGIFVPASILAFTTVMANFSTPDFHVKARFLAEQKMEELTKDPYATIAITSVSYSAVTGYAGYQWKWTVCNTRSSEINLQCSDTSKTTTDDYLNYERIEITVQMPDNLTYTVQTIVSRRPRT